MQPETFLQQLVALRRFEQARSCTAIRHPKDFNLSADLSVAIRNRCIILPVFAQFPFAPQDAYTGEPDHDPAVIASWAATYRDSNFALFVGPESGVFCLGIDLRIAKQSLQLLSDDDGWDWQNTLRFRAGYLWYTLLAWPESGLRKPAPHLAGIVIRGRGPILIPPSRLSGACLEWNDPHAKPGKAPRRLVAV